MLKFLESFGWRPRRNSLELASQILNLRRAWAWFPIFLKDFYQQEQGMVSSVRKSIAVILGVSCVAAIVYAFSAGWFSGTVSEGEVVWARTGGVADGENLRLQHVTLQSGTGQTKQLVDHKVFLGMINTGAQSFQVGLDEINRNWDISYVPMLLESIRFFPIRQRAGLFRVLTSKTGENFGDDFNAWYRWLWKQK